jgi:alpha-galactosidase
MHQLLRLDGTSSGVIIQFETGRMPTWRHWGAKVGATPLLSSWSDVALRRWPNASMDRLDGIPLLPCFGNGSPTAPALLAHRDGLGAVQDLVGRSFDRTDTDDSQTLVLHLVESSERLDHALAVTITLTLHRASDVLTLVTELRNTGLGTLQVDRLASGVVPVGVHLQDVGSFSGQWAHEYQWQRLPVPASGWQLQNRRGRSSHEAPPVCFLLDPGAGDHAGEVIAAHLGWSGNHYMSVDRHEAGEMLLQAGEWYAPGEVRLAPGASLQTPALHVTWADAGINGASAHFHSYSRQKVLQWPSGVMPVRPVHLNTWEAVYFDHDPAVLRELATQGAALGVERFVLDDGWFPGRPNDRSGLGDWWPDPKKYPQGLKPLIDHVLGLGLQFGLWVEPEMVNPDSDLFRLHPDWALQSSGRPLQTGRHQLVLDVARPAVSDYLFDKLDTLLRENAISYLKWDMNRDLAQAEDQHGRMAYGDQVHALYALLGRLRLAHPLVEIESCASGGGRMDFGVMRHTQRFWTSDNNDALSRVTIQSGAARLFPLEVLGAHVGPAPAHCTGRAQSMDFRCAVALFGHMGVETDVRKLDESDHASLGRWIALYKAWRNVLHTGLFQQGQIADGVWWMAHGGDRCLLGVYTLSPPSAMHHAPLRLPCLKGEGNWRVRLCGRAGQERARQEEPAQWLEALAQDGVVCSAAELRLMGLPLPNMNPESALVFSIELQTD